MARNARLPRRTFVSAIGVGLVIAFGWWATNRHAGWSFEGGQAQSVSFTGPSAETLMALIHSPTLLLTFGTGLVPGVTVGAVLATTAWAALFAIWLSTVLAAMIVGRMATAMAESVTASAMLIELPDNTVR